jgi:hypothetical protein
MWNSLFKSAVTGAKHGAIGGACAGLGFGLGLEFVKSIFNFGGSKHEPTTLIKCTAFGCLGGAIGGAAVRVGITGVTTAYNSYRGAATLANKTTCEKFLEHSKNRYRNN